jgi:hypothetical protein
MTFGKLLNLGFPMDAGIPSDLLCPLRFSKSTARQHFLSNGVMRRKEGLQVALEQADKGRSFVVGSRSSPGMPSRRGAPAQSP